ncbi:hypothetical protein DA2_0908 [Desulfovibrio sp. A2]|nr:hypothetical protein DA2_0908 [Desulfovibrio sp. A2]
MFKGRTTSPPRRTNIAGHNAGTLMPARAVRRPVPSRRRCPP